MGGDAAAACVELRQLRHEDVAATRVLPLLRRLNALSIDIPMLRLTGIGREVNLRLTTGKPTIQGLGTQA